MKKKYFGLDFGGHYTSYLNTGSFTGAGAGTAGTEAGGSNIISSSSAAAEINNSTTIYLNPNLSNVTVLSTNTASSSSLLANLGNSTAIVGTATASNILATSAIRGQSISEVIAEQGGADKIILNTAIQIAAQIGAQGIGSLAHSGQINQGQQLGLHATLGCGFGVGMSGGASGCAAGAAAGVIGEFTADSMYQRGNGNYSANTSVAMGGLSGAASSLVTSALLGDDDHKTSKNIYAGNFTGTNAAANNATYFGNTKIFNYPENKDYNLNVGVQYSVGPASTSYGTDGISVSIDTIPSISISGYFNVLPRGEDSALTVSYGIKDTINYNVISTDKGNVGFGMNYGINLTPIPIPFNSSLSVISDQKK